jgi:hypothetical protein
MCPQPAKDGCDQRMHLLQAGDRGCIEAAFAAYARQADLRQFVARQADRDDQFFHAFGPAVGAIAQFLVLVTADIEVPVEIGIEIVVGRQIPHQVDAGLQATEIGVVDRIEQIGACREKLDGPLGARAGEGVEHIGRPAGAAVNHRQREMKMHDRADGGQQRRHAVRLVMAVERVGKRSDPAGGGRFGHGPFDAAPARG